MFTANPRDIPSARLLKHLGYDEAQELATMGGKVLHPRCIDPVRRFQIPLHIRNTDDPDQEGTVISADAPEFGAQVKAISAKNDITLISMDTLGMWQQVGFLADAFAAFKNNGLIGRSRRDVRGECHGLARPDGQRARPSTIKALLRDLNEFCDAREIGPARL